MRITIFTVVSAERLLLVVRPLWHIKYGLRVARCMVGGVFMYSVGWCFVINAHAYMFYYDVRLVFLND